MKKMFHFWKANDLVIILCSFFILTLGVHIFLKWQQVAQSSSPAFIDYIYMVWVVFLEHWRIEVVQIFSLLLFVPSWRRRTFMAHDEQEQIVSLVNFRQKINSV